MRSVLARFLSPANGTRTFAGVNAALVVLSALLWVSGASGTTVVLSTVAIVASSPFLLFPFLNEPLAYPRWRAESNAGDGTTIQPALTGATQQARNSRAEAVARCRQKNDRVAEAEALISLGNLERALKNDREARNAYNEALNIYQQRGDGVGEAEVLTRLGNLEYELGNEGEASRAYTEASRLYDQHGGLGESASGAPGIRHPRAQALERGPGKKRSR